MLRHRSFVLVAAVAVVTLGFVVGCPLPGGDGTGGGDGGASDVVAGLVDDPQTQVGAIITASTGEKLAVLGSKAADGTLQEVTGGVFADSAGNTMTFWFGDDGLPNRASDGENTLFFGNYSNDTVDIVTVHPNGTSTFDSDVAVDPSALSQLRAAASSGGLIRGKAAVNTKSTVSAKSFDEKYQDFVKGVAFGLSVAMSGPLHAVLYEVFQASLFDAVTQEIYEIDAEVLESDRFIELSVVVAEEAAEDAVDLCGFDSDGDGVGNACDQCPSDANKTHPGTCGCGVPDTPACGTDISQIPAGISHLPPPRPPSY